jgi:hypothetical protein
MRKNKNGEEEELICKKKKRNNRERKKERKRGKRKVIDQYLANQAYQDRRPEPATRSRLR